MQTLSNRTISEDLNASSRRRKKKLMLLEKMTISMMAPWSKSSKTAATNGRSRREMQRRWKCTIID